MTQSNQKGIIQLGIIGLVILVAGLFVASSLASNSDLTFFNTATEAKDVEKAKCAGTKNGYIFRWDRNTNSCKKKELPKMLRKSEKAQDAKLSGCESGRDCKDKKFAGAKGCLSGGKTIYCCGPVEKDLGNGKCESLKSCDSGGCSEKRAAGASLCQDSKHPNGWYCCPKGKHLLTNINACSSLAGNPPACSSNECSGSLISGSSLCVTADRPEGQYCCFSGKKIVNGVCQ